MLLRFLPLVFLGLAFPINVKAEQFNNSSVIALSQAGIDDGVLLAKIDTLPCAYKVGTDDIILLKNSGVTNRVISAMVQRCVGSSRAQGGDDLNPDPSVKRRSGIYAWNPSSTEGKLKAVRPTNAGGARISGNGSIVFPFIARLSVPLSSSQYVTPNNTPSFYFYFEAADNKIGDFGTSESIAAQSPAEFSLIKFKTDKGRKEMTIGKANAFGASVGIDSKYTIPFAVDEVGDGIFKVSVSTPLAAGDYAFAIRAGSDKYRLYEFHVN